MTKAAVIRIRNKHPRLVRVADLEDAPWNFRDHPQAQQDALSGVVDELGWYGYPDVYETPHGNLRLIDGHLRKEFLLKRLGPDGEIEVNVTDFDEIEAMKATATKDPLTAEAVTNAAALDKLLREVETGSEAVAAMLTGLAEQNDIIPGDGNPTELKQLSTLPPPVMSWVLVGIPTVRFGEIAADMERIGKINGIICETTVNNG